MEQKKKTIADYQDAFKRLFREMESELGAKASEVRIYGSGNKDYGIGVEEGDYIIEAG